MTDLAWSNGTAQWAHTNVWGAGQLLATYSVDPDPAQNVPGILNFFFTDMVGTRRVMTDYAGNVMEACHSLPYGNGEDCAASPTEHLFTNKERDAETGNDYFGARYYASSMGRFLTPDWSAKVEPVPYSKLDDPQTLNLYAYVGNNPFVRTDVDGHDCSMSSGGSTTECDAEDKVNALEDYVFGGGIGQRPDGSTQASMTSTIQSYSHFKEDFTQSGDTDANTDHFSYSVQSGQLSQYAQVDDDLPDVRVIGSGYSGKGAGLNNPSMEDVPGAKGKPDAGPIPEGSYTIGKMFNNVGSTGPGSMRLTPTAGWSFPANRNPASFLMHGDNRLHNFSASEGCIIMPRNVRYAVASSGIDALEVTR